MHRITHILIRLLTNISESKFKFGETLKWIVSYSMFTCCTNLIIVTDRVIVMLLIIAHLRGIISLLRNRLVFGGSVVKENT